MQPLTRTEWIDRQLRAAILTNDLAPGEKLVTTALAEFARVTKPGGRLVICEFSAPTNGPFRRVYTEYLMRALPAVAKRVSSSPDSYVYLAESIRAWPAQRELASMVAQAGWSAVQWRNLSGGIVALHRAVKA